MSDRWQRIAGEVGRFVAVGGVATVASAILFNALVHGFLVLDAPLAHHPFLSYVLANSVGMALSYHGSRSYAFRNRPSRHADGGLKAYVVINVVTMSLPIACLFISRSVLHLTDPVSDNLSANAIGLTLGFGARFYLFRRFVFHHPGAAAAPVMAPPPALERGSVAVVDRPRPQVGPGVTELGDQVA